MDFCETNLAIFEAISLSLKSPVLCLRGEQLLARRPFLHSNIQKKPLLYTPCKVFKLDLFSFPFLRKRFYGRKIATEMKVIQIAAISTHWH